MDDFNILTFGARRDSGSRTAGFLDRVLDGNDTLKDSSSSETWEIIKRVHRLTKTKPKWRPHKGEMTWSLPCQLCFSKSFGANYYGRRLARRPFSDTAGILGQMYVDRDSAMAAHNACMWYAAGQDMIQYEDKDLEGEDHLNRFKISSIQQCVKKHKSRKCAFCNMKGACTECANPRCRGRKGWYHLPCGFKNGTVQINDKSFCGEKHALKERRSLEVSAEKRKKLVIAHLAGGSSQSAGVRRNELTRKVPPTKTSSFSSDQQPNTGILKPFSRKPSFLFIKVRKLIPFGSNVDEPSVYINIAEIQDQDTMEETVTDLSGDELSLSYNISAVSIDANATASGNSDGENVDLEEDLQLSQSRPSSPVSDGVNLENGETVQEGEVNRSQDSINVDVNGVNTSLDTLFSEIEPFDSSQSQEQANGSVTADRSFNELVSAGSAECTISELACGSGEGRVIIKADVFNDVQDEKDASTGQEATTEDSSLTLRTSLIEFQKFGVEEFPNPCDNCEIMKDQVKQVKHKFQGAVYSVDHYKEQYKLSKEAKIHLVKRLEIIKQQKNDVEKDAKKHQNTSQGLEKKLGEKEKKIINLQRANHMLKKEKDEKEKVIEDLRKEIQEKSQTIEAQRGRLFNLSNSLVQTQEEKTALEKKFGQERNKEAEGIDQLIEVLQKRKREMTSYSTGHENGGDGRKCFAKKRTSQEPEPASKRKRLDFKES